MADAKQGDVDRLILALAKERTAHKATRAKLAPALAEVGRLSRVIEAADILAQAQAQESI